MIMSELISSPSVVKKSNLPIPPHSSRSAVGSSRKSVIDEARKPIFDPFELPAATALLGISSDGLPVLFDLNDPAPGPLLILGNEGCGKVRLMQQIALSLLHNNPAEAVQISVIGHHLMRWGEVTAKARQNQAWLELSGGKKADSGEQIITAAEMTEKRYLHPGKNPAAVIFIDDLSFIFNQNAAVQLNFEWLCKHGPQVKVWLVASLETQAALSMGRWIRYFRTRIIGEMPKQNSDRLGLFPGSGAEDFLPGIEFAVYVRDAWLRFELPNAHLQTRESENT